MNAFLSSLEDLWIGVRENVDSENAEYLLQVKQLVNPLLYTDESISLTDPNHPCLRFGVQGDNAGNFRRFKEAVSAVLSENIPADEIERAYVDLMFENSTVVSLTRAMLRDFKTYSITIMDNNTDSE